MTEPSTLRAPSAETARTVRPAWSTQRQPIVSVAARASQIGPARRARHVLRSTSNQRVIDVRPTTAVITQHARTTTPADNRTATTGPRQSLGIAPRRATAHAAICGRAPVAKRVRRSSMPATIAPAARADSSTSPTAPSIPLPARQLETATVARFASQERVGRAATARASTNTLVHRAKRALATTTREITAAAARRRLLAGRIVTSSAPSATTAPAALEA